MMDDLETATGFETIVTMKQEEVIVFRNIPELEGIFGPMDTDLRLPVV